MKGNKRFISLFEKSVIVFLIMGIIPLFIMGSYLFTSFSNQMKKSVIANYSQMNEYISLNVSTAVEEMDEVSKSIYGYQIAEYDYFYELLQDEGITEAERELWITNILRNLLYSNQYIDQVYWINNENQVYSSMHPPEKMVNTEAMSEWHQANRGDIRKELSILPTHVSSYFFYSNRQDITFMRQIMDTSTVQGAQNEQMGTLYIDMSADRIGNIMEEASAGIKGDFYVIDQTSDVYIYSSEYYVMGESAEEITKQLSASDREENYVRRKEGYLLYTPIKNTDWLLVAVIPDTEISASAKAMRESTVWIMVIASILVGIIYWHYSKVTSTPLRDLKDAMLRIQEGNLETHVDIRTNDEVGIIAEGLNRMTENLRTHINRVYIAEIKQRDAELDALKAQIQPHYLYNTLEVIRMMAVTNDDLVTAEMLDSLSRQLKYLIGTEGDMVVLKDEIENIKDYFKLIRLRFENVYSLDIDIPEKLLGLKVPHLILQPIVENAIKHGLRPKGEEGQIGITARGDEKFLEISVIDNGVGMTEEKLAEIEQQFQMSDNISDKVNTALMSIGMSNVYERIVLKFGAEYGLQMKSQLGLGTIVKYKLPVMHGGD